MNPDKAVHARAMGKSRVQASIVWELNIGGFLHLRCLPFKDGFEVQVKGPSGWKELTHGRSPGAMLHAAVNSNTTGLALENAVLTIVAAMRRAEVEP